MGPLGILVFLSLLALLTSSTTRLPRLENLDGGQAVAYTPDAERDRVTSLPGLGQVHFNMFSG